MNFFDEITKGLPAHSSDEEDNARKENLKRVGKIRCRSKPLQPARKKHKPELRTDNDQKEALRAKPDKTQPLSALVALDPKLCVETKQKLAASAGAAKENPLKEVTLQKLIEAHTKLLGNVHIAQQMFGSQQVDVKSAVEELMKGTATLAAVPWWYESALLGEAGTFEMHKEMGGAKRTFVPCRNGAAECIGKRDWGYVFRSWMSMPEFQAFIDKAETPPQRPCIICHRVVVEDLVCSVNSSSKTIKIDPETALLQQYTNLMECPGGYKKEYMQLYPADDGIYCGVVGPLVAYQKHHLAEFQDKDQINCETRQPARMLSQEKIIWSPQLGLSTPQLGETSSDFQSGAAFSSPRRPPLLLTHSM